MPPPVRRPTNTPVAAPEVAPEPVPPRAEEQPPEEPPKTWEPPPVRRKPETTSVAPRLRPPPEPTVHEYTPPPHRGKRLVWIVAAFAIGVALLLGVGGYLVWTTIIHTEGNLAKAAEAAYHAEKYTKAGADYHGLVNQFPNSDKHSYYQLMQQLCELRSHVGTPDPDIAACLDELDQLSTTTRRKMRRCSRTARPT